MSLNTIGTAGFQISDLRLVSKSQVSNLKFFVSIVDSIVSIVFKETKNSQGREFLRCRY